MLYWSNRARRKDHSLQKIQNPLFRIVLLFFLLGINKENRIRGKLRRKIFIYIIF